MCRAGEGGSEDG
ncbi:unnamed protein product, partial [Didymodactylos carnosus]